MKKKIDILIGTHNKGKFREISYLLSKKLRKYSPTQFKIKSPKETGKSFKENSILKANFFCKKSNVTTLSDDSGLSVDCLGGKPGIYSSRWAKRYGGFKNAMKMIIKLTEQKNKGRRKKNFKAHFICSLTIKFPQKKSKTVIGKVFGKISNKIKGKNGFGYDAIFIPNGHQKTFGEMSNRKKMLIDHRYFAFKKLKKKISFL